MIYKLSTGIFHAKDIVSATGSGPDFSFSPFPRRTFGQWSHVIVFFTKTKAARAMPSLDLNSA